MHHSLNIFSVAIWIYLLPSSSCRAFRYIKSFNGLRSMKLFSANGNISILSTQLGGKSFFSIKSDGRTKAAVLSEDGDLRSHPAGTNDAIALGTLAAETTPTIDFPIADDEFDLDLPTEGFASIPEAIEDIRQGKIVVVVDDEDRENEGDLIMAASMVTPEAVVFFVKHGTGIVCVSVEEEDLERLKLPLIVSGKDNNEKL